MNTAYSWPCTVPLAEAPGISRIVRAAVPNYRKRSVRIRVANTVALHGTFWDGGSRSTYTAVDLATARCIDAPQYAPAAFGGPSQAPVVELPRNVAIVESGVFCGKPATVRVHIRPENAQTQVALEAGKPGWLRVRVDLCP
jgi:hypothetical protein